MSSQVTGTGSSGEVELLGQVEQFNVVGEAGDEAQLR